MAADPLRVELRPVREADVPTFFEHVQDAGAAWQVAFTSDRIGDRDAFTTHWANLIHDPSALKWTIEVDGAVAGNVVCFEMAGQREIGYWVGRSWWGRGVATEAVSQLLGLVDHRPLYGVVAADNAASIRVLEKCGFRRIGRDREFSRARGQDVDQVILRLDRRGGA